MDEPANNLWYARFMRHILNAVDDLDAAGSEMVRAKDDALFKEIHEMRMKLLDIASKLIKNPRKT